MIKKTEFKIGERVSTQYGPGEIVGFDLEESDVCRPKVKLEKMHFLSCVLKEWHKQFGSLVFFPNEIRRAK